MALAKGTRFGPHEIVSVLGAGGMGEVYRATDTKLGREVALKVLPASFASDPERLARFTREAQTLASLNHPHIAAVYGLEDAGGVRALVMELVEGDDLSQRITGRPLPLDEALPIARQVAEALEAAHERGIVHRDLKPANVKVRPDGTVKVLDFGLARAMDPGGVSGVDPTTSPTLTAHATQMGVILGTAAYMAPEQARGKPVDRRADIWAFGVVLYEMVTGRRAFVGEGVSDVLAAVLRQDIDWSALPAETPQGLRRLLERCLERDPKQRLRDIGEARIAIDEIARQPASPGSAAPSPVPVATRQPQRALRSWLGTGLGLAAAALSGALVAWWALAPRSSSTAETVAPRNGLVRATIELPASAPLALGSRITRAGFDSAVVAVSPDGRYLAYVGQASGGTMLYLRELSGTSVVAVAGTEGAISPFFSPRGDWLGFLTDDKVKKVALGGGAPVTVCEAQTPVRGQWTRDDTIYFSTDYGMGLWRVAAAGGRPAKIPDIGYARFSDVSPNGRWGLRTDHLRSINGDYASVSIVPLGGGPDRVIVSSGYDARFVDDETVLFARAGTLHAIAFDPGLGVTRGDSRSVASGVAMDSLFQQVQATASGPVLAYVPGGERSIGRLAWVDEQGQTEFLNAPDAVYGVVSLSRDDRRLAVHVGDVNDHVWVYDFARREGRRLVVGENSGWPAWSPDGQSLAVRAWADEISASHVVTSRVDGGASPREIAGRAVPPVGAYSWSPDGRLLALSSLVSGPMVSFAGADGAGAGPASLTFPGHMPAFSPDGRWVAYTSSETGQLEIYARSFPDGGNARQISTGGGGEPIWCPCGEVFYRNANRWMSVKVRTQPDLQWDAPRLRFETDFVDTPGRSYDVSADGTRLLVVKRATSDSRNRIDVVVNWRQPRPDVAAR